MKNTKLILILFISVLFIDCASVGFVKEPPFTIESAIYYPSKFNNKSKVYIRYTPFEKVVFDSLFLKNKKAKTLIKTKGDLKYIFVEFDKTLNNKDLILDNNRTKESINQLPSYQNSSFKLNRNEVVISYLLNNKTYYYKVKNLKEVSY
ncbi:hypothetical protein [Polaribacter sargassicola]|uniref:hypothetical protein n=1 Tax=Polaribacter sargassicola TaxID=2836891 RepID=UPI001F28C39F|nr:hypothetical protein [Polaribacter sp. DS7-9]MCG1034997.1 hypothetical protein [Polaribacter sp. DS7-9]